MGKDETVESLLKEICYVVDFLPSLVPAERGKEFLEVEAYFLQEKERKEIAEKFKRIIVKLSCYHSFQVFCGHWYETVSVKELADLVEQVVCSEDMFLNLLCTDDDILIQIEGATLHISVYNPPLILIGNLSALATAEGMFLRRGQNKAL